MTQRTTTRTVTFARPFKLSGLDELLPAGDYSVETDEDLLDGLSFPAYRRSLTVIHLPRDDSHPGATRSLTVDPTLLDAALLRDRAAAPPPVGQAIEADPAAPLEPSRKAIERGENEGMALEQIRVDESPSG